MTQSGFAEPDGPADSTRAACAVYSRADSGAGTSTAPPAPASASPASSSPGSASPATVSGRTRKTRPHSSPSWRPLPASSAACPPLTG